MRWNTEEPNYRHYKNFDELYDSLFEEVLTEPQYLDCSMGIVENLFISCDSYECHLQPRDVLYKPISKWKYLCSRYLDYDEWIKFKRELNEDKTPISRTFRFNVGNKEVLSGKRAKAGPCILTLVLSRNMGCKSSKYNRIDITFRNSNIDRKLLFDLILINRMLTELDEYDIVNIQRINFHMITSFIAAHYIAALMALNKNPSLFFGDNNNFKPRKYLLDEANYFNSINYIDLKKVDGFKYQVGRRFHIYYDPDGECRKLKLSLQEKLRHYNIIDNLDQYITIDYDLLSLDGTYRGVTTTEYSAENTEDKNILW